LIPIFSQQIYSLSQQAMRADRHHPPPVQNHRFLENERALPPGGKGIGHYPLVSTIAWKPLYLSFIAESRSP